jgi:hypothetical protein
MLKKPRDFAIWRSKMECLERIVEPVGPNYIKICKPKFTFEKRPRPESTFLPDFLTSEISDTDMKPDPSTD